jgi:hypothetical protein
VSARHHPVTLRVTPLLGEEGRKNTKRREEKFEEEERKNAIPSFSRRGGCVAAGVVRS